MLRWERRQRWSLQMSLESENLDQTNIKTWGDSTIPKCLNYDATQFITKRLLQQCPQPVHGPLPVLAPSPSSISSSRLSILASPSSWAKCRVSTICQATLCRGRMMSKSSPNLPRCSQVASSSSSWAWKRRCRTSWGLSRPGQSAGQRYEDMVWRAESST